MPACGVTSARCVTAPRPPDSRAAPSRCATRRNLRGLLSALPQSRRRRLATFGGSIPAGLGQLAALQSLDLGANGLSGTIPADSARIARPPPSAPCFSIHWGDAAGFAEPGCIV